MADDPIETVRAFLGALEELNVEGALEHASPRIVYQNVPLPPARGIDATRKVLNLMARYGTGFRADIHSIAASGATVLTERTDVLESGRWYMSFWVCGTFEVSGGRIELWRDYFDWGTVLAAGLRGTARAGLAALRRP